MCLTAPGKPMFGTPFRILSDSAERTPLFYLKSTKVKTATKRQEIHTNLCGSCAFLGYFRFSLREVLALRVMLPCRIQPHPTAAFEPHVVRFEPTAGSNRRPCRTGTAVRESDIFPARALGRPRPRTHTPAQSSGNPDWTGTVRRRVRCAGAQCCRASPGRPTSRAGKPE